MITFIHDSDLHYGRNDLSPRNCKETHPEHISNEESDFVIVTGDLTENGYDGAYFACISYGGNKNQRRALVEKYVKPIERSGKDVYLCIGNHDKGKKTLGLFRHPTITYLLRNRHGGLKYTFHKGDLKFVCCGKYPKDLGWLRKQLDPEEPTILFFHFNLEGPYSGWWTRKEKKAFNAVIQDYNIIAILVGHHHISKISEWNGRTVISAGDEYARITYDPSIQKIANVEFRR
uniref:Calcineurin-like phosphoesterase domain-containing protein n=1 Tax=Pithovirus LCPAC304 TaxID=2506594 RepID=A0A481Z727_9VIRU|nr:MAG: hypothetical protein LCPAC304_00190 [Pithovirus LCPAC304]